jgi:hypothetical protein
MVVIMELHSMFCFHLKELGQLKGHEMKIILEDDKLILGDLITLMKWNGPWFRLK